jgi:hypothetical protein
LCLIKHHTIKTDLWSGGIAPFFNLGTRWRWVVSFLTRASYPLENIWYLVGRRLHGPFNQSGSCATTGNPTRTSRS